MERQIATTVPSAKARLRSTLVIALGSVDAVSQFYDG